MNTKVFKIALEHIGLDDQSKKNKQYVRDSLERQYPLVLGAFLRRMKIDLLPRATDFIAQTVSKKSDVPKQRFYTAINNLRGRFMEALNEIMDDEEVIDLIFSSLPDDADLTEDDIAAHVREYMTSVKRDMIYYLRRSQDLL